MNIKMNFVKSMGYRVFSDDLQKINLNTKQITINTISPNSYGISTKDSLFEEALKKSDYLVLDGVYFALSALFLQGKNIKKNQGPDLFDFFIKKMNSESGRVFFLGSNSVTLEKIRNRLQSEYKNITSEFLSPPFKSAFSTEDNNFMVEAINNFKPDIVFVGMTCPKQEKWAHQNKYKLDTKLICSIGAVFDWYAGNQKEINPLWWKFRLGWLKRTIDRPEILNRYPNIGILNYIK
jgi:N-acetylglucosaminyldiphosphoundecaprenol N-acetyl-beta-D-mannosaminyltransferase